MIEPYEQTLKNMKAADKRLWAQGVLAELRKRCDLETDNFVFLAGTPYRENIVPHLKHYSIPMKGLKGGDGWSASLLLTEATLMLCGYGFPITIRRDTEEIRR